MRTFCCEEQILNTIPTTQTGPETLTMAPTSDNTTAEPTTAPASDEASVYERQKASFEYTKSSLLGKRIKTTLSDGRTLTGKFICIDRLKNLILTNVTEERLVDPSDYRYRVDNDTDETNHDERRIKVQRQISQAMIPGSRLVKAEISEAL